MPGGWQGSRGASTFPPDWRQRRARRAAHAGGRCECDGACDKHPGRCTQPGTECDHHDDDHTNHAHDNLRWLCSACHNVKTLKKAQQARRDARDALRHPSQRAAHPGLA